VDPFPDTLILRKSGSVGNRTLTSGSVARNSDNKAIEAFELLLFLLLLLLSKMSINLSCFNSVSEGTVC
jgi:hypothetical protein